MYQASVEEYPDLYMEVGNSLWSSGLSKQAVYYFEQVASIKPIKEDIEFGHKLALAQTASEKYEQAADTYRYRICNFMKIDLK